MNPIDSAQLDAIFRLLRREVWIVTAADGSRHGGLTATFVTRTSIDPQTPVMLVGIAANHFTRELIDASGTFALHLLQRNQAELAWQFGLGSGRQRDKLAGLSWQSGLTGSPILDGVLAWLDCRVYDRHDGGDRVYYWGDVEAAASVGSGEPLADRELLAVADDAQRTQFANEMVEDIRRQAPLLAQRRAQIQHRRGSDSP